jgi:hypothetical protein
MIGSQLGRVLLASTAETSTDQQVAEPDETGSYGELMDVLDRFIEDATGTSAPKGPGRTS